MIISTKSSPTLILSLTKNTRKRKSSMKYSSSHDLQIRYLPTFIISFHSVFIPIVNKSRDRSSKYSEFYLIQQQTNKINQSTRIDENEKDFFLLKSTYQSICTSSKSLHSRNFNQIDLLHNFSMYKFDKYERILTNVKHIDEDLVRSNRSYRYSPNEKYARSSFLDLFFQRDMGNQSLLWRDWCHQV